ncbi:MAG: MutS family DNA mismatch repair protein [Planctomycetota bacterium]
MTGNYAESIQKIQTLLDSLKSRDQRIGWLRVLLVLLAIIFGVVSTTFWPAFWIGVACFIGFLVVATVNEPIREEMQVAQTRLDQLKRLDARDKRDWETISTKRSLSMQKAVDIPETWLNNASDLDLLGKASLFHLVSVCGTKPGVETLVRWLTGPAIPEDANDRFDVAAAFAKDRERRLDLYATLAQMGADAYGPDEFQNWAASNAYLENNRWLDLWSKAALILGPTSMLMAFAFLSNRQSPLFTVGIVVFGLTLAINLIITMLFLGPAHAAFSAAMRSRKRIDDYRDIFASIEDWQDLSEIDNPLIAKLRRGMVDTESSALTGLQELAKIARWGGLRQSPATFFLYLPLQFLVLYDVHVLRKLEAWQVQHRSFVPNWFSSLGIYEALLSIASVHDEQADWVRPQWIATTDSDLAVSGKVIGHPLLTDQQRVCNDVTMGPVGKVLLVTGSNMSGKSTMLRSVGLNVALAGLGAPVCAASFRLPPTEMATSIRVSDDVSQGVSFYMAELYRLKSVIDRADSLASSSDLVCLFLLDEILRGTNSSERQIAVVGVLKHLVNARSIGAITTHDLELADESDVQSVCQTVHFRETINPDADGNERMTFDYVMRAGVSPTTNALALMKMVGLRISSKP